jgi:hypothetical protein
MYHGQKTDCKIHLQFNRNPTLAADLARPALARGGSIISCDTTNAITLLILQTDGKYLNVYMDLFQEDELVLTLTFEKTQ